jgi:hypothetical protein
MTVKKSTLLGLTERFARRLRFPQLFWLTAVLFVLDLLIPDLIPFADEILLGLATLLLGSWKQKNDSRPRKEGAAEETREGPVIDVTPDG